MTSNTELKKLIGQLFIVGFDGYSVPANFKKCIQDYNVGGVIYFKRNVQSPAQLAELSNELQFQCRAKDTAPLIISIDHEGGIVNRLAKPFTLFPGIDYLGEMGSPKVAFNFGMILGKELKAVGVNLNYAPVVDVLTNPTNPVMKNRTFSDDPELVARMGSAVCRGLQKVFVAACAKHFPGHGDTTEDSHFSLPKVTKTLEELDKCELIPFRKMVRSRVETIMTAHILNPNLDPDLPATLSPKTINDLLRTEMRYTKVIISDDMDMKAIADNFGADEAPVMALQAGCDMLIYRGDAGFPIHAVEAIEKAVIDKKLSKTRLEVSIQRIANLKKGYCDVSAPISIPEVGKYIGLPEHYQLAEMIQRKEVPKEDPNDRSFD